MSPGVLLFTGPPESSALDWKQPGLLDNFGESFCRFARLDRPQHVSISSGSTSSALPAWRSIPVERQHLATGHSQTHGWQEEYRGAQFFTTDSFVQEFSQLSDKESQVSVTEPVDQVLSQFYEQSYAVHEDIASSQLAASSYIGSSSSSLDITDASQEDSLSGKRDIPVAGKLSNLKDIPNAGYLTSIQPQTVTVNLIVGIISIPSPRSIKTRRGDTVELIEIIAGDESKSGFGINFWLSSSQTEAVDMSSILTTLRPQDVVLMRNVALSSFLGKVYGQSLRKGLTKVHLLYRNRINKSDLPGCYNASDLAIEENAPLQIAKTRKVKAWVMSFVGVGAGRQVKNQIEAIKEILPPDTQ
jgi:hypothetical protein